MMLLTNTLTAYLQPTRTRDDRSRNHYPAQATVDRASPTISHHRLAQIAHLTATAMGLPYVTAAASSMAVKPRVRAY
jgi:hypothetical protein